MGSRQGSRSRPATQEIDGTRDADDDIPPGQPQPEEGQKKTARWADQEDEPLTELPIQMLRQQLRDSTKYLGPDNPNVQLLQERIKAAQEKQEREKPPEEKLQSLKDKIKHQEEKVSDAKYYLDMKEEYLERVKEQHVAAQKDHEEQKTELDQLKAKKQELLDTISKQDMPGQPREGLPEMSDIERCMNKLGIRLPKKMPQLATAAANELMLATARLSALMEDAIRQEASAHEQPPPDTAQDVRMGLAESRLEAHLQIAKESTNHAGALLVASRNQTPMATPASTPRARKAPEREGVAHGMANKTRRGDEQGGVLVSTAPVACEEGGPHGPPQCS